MEIHSSSLAFVPNKPSANKRNDPSESLNSKQETPSTGAASASTDNTRRQTDVVQLQKISDELKQQNNSSTHTPNARAINAYQQESSLSLRNQRSQLVSSIDLFV